MYRSIKKYDDYELKDKMISQELFAVGFTNQKTIRLDNDIILYFKKMASKQKVPYQTLINAYLRKEIDEVMGLLKRIPPVRFDLLTLY